MQNLEQGMKIVQKLGYDYSVLEWHEASAEILRLTGIPATAQDNVDESKTIYELCEKGTDDGAISILWNFCYGHFGDAKFVSDKLMPDINLWLEARAKQ